MSKSSQCHISHPILEAGFSLRGYLGMSYINSEGQKVCITEEEFATFMPIIATSFPDGFTIYDAKGGYYDSVLKKTVMEPSKVLEVIISQTGAKKSIVTFANLMDTYTIMFKQSGTFWTKNVCEFFSK